MSDDDGEERASVGIRKISNGFLSTTAREMPDGSFKQIERHHQKRPTIEEVLGAEPMGEKPEQVNHLKAATKLLKGRRA